MSGWLTVVPVIIKAGSDFINNKNTRHASNMGLLGTFFEAGCDAYKSYEAGKTKCHEADCMVETERYKYKTSKHHDNTLNHINKRYFKDKNKKRKHKRKIAKYNKNNKVDF